MIATCPCCCADLIALKDFRLGPLNVVNSTFVHWNGALVPLSVRERLLLMALVRADGVPVKRHILAEATGYEGDQPENLASVLVSRINKSFRRADPAFDMIENVWGYGLRWKTGEDRLLAA